MRQLNHSNICISFRYHRGKAHCVPSLAFLQLSWYGAKPRFLLTLLDKAANRQGWRARSVQSYWTTSACITASSGAASSSAQPSGVAKSWKGRSIPDFSSSSGCGTSLAKAIPCRKPPFVDDGLRLAFHVVRNRKSG